LKTDVLPIVADPPRRPRRRIPINGILIALLVMCAVLAVAAPSFLSVDNLLILTRQSIFVMIGGLAMTFVIAMGGIDLSVGAILAFTGIIAASLLVDGFTVGMAVLVALAVGVVIGLINGTLIAIFTMPDFIVTLGVMVAVRGVIMVYTQGIPIYGLQNPQFQWLAQGHILGIPTPVIFGFLLLGVMAFVLRRTPLGRNLLAIGSSPQAAFLTGIRVNRVKVIVYGLSGLFAGIAGVLLTSRMEAGIPESGDGYELDVIAAVVIGGTSLSGGKANLLGTVIGALVMAVVRNGLTLMNVNTFWHQVVIGVIILLAVGMDRISQRASGRIRKG